VVGFPMRGDLIGLDAIRSGRYPVTVRALEEANVAALPYRELVDLARTYAPIEQTILQAVSAELLRNYEVMRAIGVLGAEARLARFLHLLCERGARFGFSRSLLRLSMSRADIASYLGLSVETVCRAFTSLAARGIIDVRRRTVRVLDRERFEHADSIEPHSMQRACAVARRRAPESAAAVPAAPRALGAVN
jgi:CRP/FNR family transcriptional regulator